MCFSCLHWNSIMCHRSLLIWSDLAHLCNIFCSIYIKFNVIERKTGIPINIFLPMNAHFFNRSEYFLRWNNCKLNLGLSQTIMDVCNKYWICGAFFPERVDKSFEENHKVSWDFNPKLKSSSLKNNYIICDSMVK